MTSRFVRDLGKSLVDHDMLDVGAMLAYYAVMAIFPMIVFVGSIALVVIPPATIAQGVTMASDTMPPGVRDVLAARIDALLQTNHAGFAIGGAALALWGASRGAAALSLALDKIYERTDRRSWIRRQLTAIGVTVAVAMLIVLALGLLVIGPLVGHGLGLGGAFDTAWTIGRWIGAGILTMVVWAVVYRYLPDTDAPFRVFTLGTVIGVAMWLATSALFGLYLSHFASYEATYGALGTAIIFLIWLWLSNIALLFGAELDHVVVHRSRNMAEAHGNRTHLTVARAKSHRL